MDSKIIISIMLFTIVFSSAALAKTYTLNLEVKDEMDFDQTLNLTFYKAGTNEAILNELVDGNTSVQLSSPKVDFEINYDDYLVILLQNFSVSDMNEKIIINDALTFVDGYNTLNAYVIQLPNFNFDNAVFKMYYGEAIDDTKISLLKCSNFNFDDYECSGNWTSVPITLVRNQTMAVANVKTFSVYSLVEPEDLEETTTTTTETTSTTQTSPQTTTSNPSQSGGQGGSSNNQLTTTTQSTQTSSVSQITTQTSSTSISQTQTKTSDSSASVSSSEFNPFIIPILILIIFAGVLFYMKHPTKKHKTKRYGEKVKLSFD